MKKTCFGCRALDFDFRSKRCELGYKQTGKYHRKQLWTEPIPAEQCPKPTTYEAFSKLLEGK